jgi:hypothetical protein
VATGEVKGAEEVAIAAPFLDTDRPLSLLHMGTAAVVISARPAAPIAWMIETGGNLRMAHSS